MTTRTPTQVASHAQKYFLRKNSLNKRRRRTSLFDVRFHPSLSNFKHKNVNWTFNFQYLILYSFWQVGSETFANQMLHFRPPQPFNGYGFLSKKTSTVPIILDARNPIQGNFGDLELPFSHNLQPLQFKESFHIQPNSLTMATAKSEAPDLELSLAAPKALDQSEACSHGHGLLFGPITVT